MRRSDRPIGADPLRGPKPVDQCQQSKLIPWAGRQMLTAAALVDPHNAVGLSASRTSNLSAVDSLLRQMYPRLFKENGK